MELDQLKSVKVNAKTLKIHIKVCDGFSAKLVDQDGSLIKEQSDGYVPEFMPGDHYGDYVILDIDIDSGLVTNWKKLTPKSLQGWIDKERDNN